MKKVKVFPVKSFSLNISDIAPDKSISHRSVMLSMLAEGAESYQKLFKSGRYNEFSRDS